MRIALVVPCFNEAARLDAAAYVERLEADPALSIVFVDDGSTDGTAAALDALAARRPDQMEVVKLARNQGKAEAVRAGMGAAFARDPEWVGYWDADLATPFAELDAMRGLAAAHPDVLVIMGSRVKLLGRAIERKSSRHYLGRVFATLASSILGMPVYDTQCGAKLIRATPLTKSLFDDPFSMRWLVDVEILARLRKALGRDPSPSVIEHPLHAWHDVRGSKVRPADFFTSIVALLRIAWRYR